MNMITTRTWAIVCAAPLAVACMGCAGSNVQDVGPAVQEARVGVRHVLVQYQGSDRASSDITRSKEEALARAKECLERAKQGEKFEDLAMEYSDCPSAAQGGDLGKFSAGRMDPTFEAASFACEVGGLTDIVETPFGYHIIYRYE